MSSPDVVVLGAGAIGASAAYEFARRGARVAVLERGEAAQGCSYGNAGLISPSHAESLASVGAIRDAVTWMRRRESPFYVRPRPALVPWLARFAVAALPARSARATATLRSLARASLELHDELARAGLPTGFKRRGILSVYESERAFAGARAAVSRNGVGPELLDPGAARQLEPALNPRIAGAVYRSGEAHCDPTAYVTSLLDAAREHGADVRTGVEVLRLRRTGARIDGLETTAGILRADAIVLATGAWSGELARHVSIFLPLESGKGYHLELDTGAVGVDIPIYMEESHVIATPLDGRLRLAGTLELSGMDLTVDPIRLDSLRHAAQRALSLPANARTVNVWRGLRPCTPDGLPAIGPADGVDNLFIATGHAMLGITLAPVTGEILASLVTGQQPKHDIEPLLPARFRRTRGMIQDQWLPKVKR